MTLVSGFVRTIANHEPTRTNDNKTLLSYVIQTILNSWARGGIKLNCRTKAVRSVCQMITLAKRQFVSASRHSIIPPLNNIDEQHIGWIRKDQLSPPSTVLVGLTAEQINNLYTLDNQRNYQQQKSLRLFNAPRKCHHHGRPASLSFIHSSLDNHQIIEPATSGWPYIQLIPIKDADWPHPISWTIRIH